MKPHIYKFWTSNSFQAQTQTHDLSNSPTDFTNTIRVLMYMMNTLFT